MNASAFQISCHTLKKLSKSSESILFCDSSNVETDISCDHAKESNLKEIAVLVGSTFDSNGKGMSEVDETNDYFERIWLMLKKLYFIYQQESSIKKRWPRTTANSIENYHYMFVAKFKEKIIGFLEIGLVSTPESVIDYVNHNGIPKERIIPCIGNLVVSKRFRNKGVAIILMNKGICALNDISETIVMCKVIGENINALNLYTKHFDFVIVETCPNSNRELKLRYSPNFNRVTEAHRILLKVLK